jgi:hypothetical protein
VLVENPGPTAVFIHVPVPSGNDSQGETVIRTTNQIHTAAAASELQRRPEIVKVWEQ